MKPNSNNRAHNILLAFFNRDDISINTLRTIRKILKCYAVAFYAAELDIKGGTLSGLRSAGIIKPTGNVKYEIVLVDEYEQLYRKVEILEWELAVPRNLLEDYYRNFLSTLEI